MLRLLHVLLLRAVLKMGRVAAFWIVAGVQNIPSLRVWAKGKDGRKPMRINDFAVLSVEGAVTARIAPHRPRPAIIRPAAIYK